MKIIALASFVLICTALPGCSAAPRSDSMASAHVRVIAKPKAGVTERFTRVPVYDAAPAPAVATGAFEHVDYKNLSDIIVWLEPTARASSVAKPPHAIGVDPQKPSNHVHAASVGQTIDFRNTSSRPIVLYSVSDGNEFELPPTPSGASASFTPKSEGLIEILADPAKPPIAQIYVAPSPWVARARAGQTVKFDNVPPGEYRIIAWHPRLPSSTSKTTLQAGQVTNSTITIGVNALSDSSR